MARTMDQIGSKGTTGSGKHHHRQWGSVPMDVKQKGGSGRGLAVHHTALFSFFETGAEHGASAGNWPAPENRGHHPTGREGVSVVACGMSAARMCL
jgi:hypothetical protein